MNLNLLPDLALFVQIVDQGSFSAVARQNGITPSAVSRSVSRLERDGLQTAAAYHPQAAS